MKYLLIFLVFSCCSHKPFIQVIDGDSIKIIKNNKILNIRLAHIDAPELKQSFGPESKKFLESLLKDTHFNIEITGKGAFGRSLGVIYIAGKNLNLEMVKNGYAWHYRKYSKSLIYYKYQELARQSNKGLWSRESPIEPWSFRKREPP